MGKQNKKFSMLLIVVGLFVVLFLVTVVLSLIESKTEQVSPSKNDPDPGATDHALGHHDAGVILIEYGDFDCQECVALSQSLKSILAEYVTEVKLIYRHFPLTSIHANSMLASQAAQSAGAQGKFFEYHDMLLRKQSEWSSVEDPMAIFKNYALEIGLDIKQFTKDVNSQAIVSEVNYDLSSAKGLGLEIAPVLFLNGTNVNLSGGYESLKRMIDDELARLEEVGNATIEAGSSDEKEGEVGSFLEE